MILQIYQAKHFDKKKEKKNLTAEKTPNMMVVGLFQSNIDICPISAKIHILDYVGLHL